MMIRKLRLVVAVLLLHRIAFASIDAGITYIDVVEGVSGNTYQTGSILSDTTWYDGVGVEVYQEPLLIGDRLLGIDFNCDDYPSAPSQSRCRIISGSSTNSAANLSAYTKNMGPWSVTVSRPDAQPFEFRGANGDASRDIPGGDTSLSYLAADFIGTRSGRIDIAVSGLPVGNYVLRSYHVEPHNAANLGFSQGSSPSTPNTYEARIGTNVIDSVQPTALGASGLNTTFISDSHIPVLEIPFAYTNGVLTIGLNALLSNGSDSFLFLNGFEIFNGGTP